MPLKQSTQWEFDNLFDPDPADAVKETPPPKESAKPKVWTVGTLTRNIRSLLEGRFRSIQVSGEVSNFRAQSSGHCYFTLKDGDAQLSCVLFRGERVSHREQLDQGVKLILRGDISVYMPRGQYQMIVRGIELEGTGALQLAFEKLKLKLKEEGLFDEARKRPLPAFPNRIGIVTSTSGAALRDIVHVLGRRHPGLNMVVAGCRVQGQGAAEEIAASIRNLNAWHAADPARRGLDLILVSRGGGSLEDLWAFNEEVVARAIASSELPVVSAVGHEIDFTISDFVADVRAATPSAAAEMISEGAISALHFLGSVPDRMLARLQDFLDQAGLHAGQIQRRLEYLHPRRVLERHGQRLDDLQDSLRRESDLCLEKYRDRLDRAGSLLRSMHPKRQWQEQRLAFDRCRGQCSSALRIQLQRHTHRLERASTQLKLLGPSDVLARGYSITHHSDSGEILRSAQGLQEGDTITTRFHDGQVKSRVSKPS